MSFFSFGLKEGILSKLSVGQEKKILSIKQNMFIKIGIIIRIRFINGLNSSLQNVHVSKVLHKTAFVS